MPMSERRERNAYAFKHVLTHTAQHWAETFVNALHSTTGPARSPVVSTISCINVMAFFFLTCHLSD